MEILSTKIEGVFVIHRGYTYDAGGSFYKSYSKDIFKRHNLSTNFKESYYSISKKDVIRGMHFQLPPYDHEKLVYVIKGSILDVVLDLRKNSNTYGRYISIELLEKNGLSVYVPRGCAHGFRSLENESIVVYNVTTIYDSDSDTGIRWDSFGMEWEIENPIVSKKDSHLTSFSKYKSPF